MKNGLTLYTTDRKGKRTVLTKVKEVPYPSLAVAVQRLSGTIDLLTKRIIKIEVVESGKVVAYWQVGGHGIQWFDNEKRKRHEAQAKQQETGREVRSRETDAPAAKLRRRR